jgi:transposase, IS5 family
MKYSSQHKQLSLEDFKSSLSDLPKDNRWVKLGDSLPWKEIERIYNSRLYNAHGGAGNKPARVIVGALLIKHKMNLSDEETIQAILENPYMQYMLGLSEFTNKPVFDSSLFVTIRKRLSKEDFNDMSESLLELQVKMLEDQNKESRGKSDSNDNTSSGTSVKEGDSYTKSKQEVETFHKGTLKVDATCADAEMRYPTDIDLLHDGVEVVDRIIDHICEKNGLPRPNTHLKEIHSKYLNVIKLRTKPKKQVHECMEYLLTMLYRNIKTSLKMLCHTSTALFTSMKRVDRELYITVLKMYNQQKKMFKEGVHVCADRIVSIFQPHVRPIVRGKARSKVEFGAKIGVSVVDGYTFIDHHSWDAYNECDDLMLHLRSYKKRFGCLPEKLEGDKIYMNRRNRRILKFLKIEIGGKPLGRPSSEQRDEEYRKKMAKNIGERNEVEATFGTGKRIYRANNIRAKRPDTGEAWTSACYFSKNVMKFLRELLYALIEMMDILKIKRLVLDRLKSQWQLDIIYLIPEYCNKL